MLTNRHNNILLYLELKSEGQMKKEIIRRSIINFPHPNKVDAAQINVAVHHTLSEKSQRVFRNL